MSIKISYILDSMRHDKTILVADKEGVGKLTYDEVIETERRSESAK
jgi:hypothetical protein